MELNKLKPNRKSRKVATRLGRGNGSGLGKTCGKGHKGQKARSGVSIPFGFEGGQMPLYRRIPKVGFVSRKRVLGLNIYNEISLSDLNKFDDGAVVNVEALKALGLGTRSSKRAGIKILGSGELEKKLTVQVQAVTKSAQKAIEAKGGTVELVKKKDRHELGSE
jgi:large subunit ribosomal protein L15